MTEEEAASKACPARGLNTTCIGSRCMMWRWNIVTDDEATTGAWAKWNERNKGHFKIFASLPLDPLPIPQIKLSETHGYCGLGEKP